MKKILMAAAIAGVFVAAPASAQWYLGGGIGAGQAKLGSQSASAGTTTVTVQGNTDWNTSGKIFGGYQFTPNWGVEGQYVYLGKSNFSATSNNGTVSGNGSFNAQSWGIAATGTLPLSNSFYLMAKLGAAFNHVDNINGCATGPGGTACVGGNDNKTDLLVGAGAGYNFTPNWGLRVEYENFGKMAKNVGDVKGQNFAVSVKYSF